MEKGSFTITDLNIAQIVEERFYRRMKMNSKHAERWEELHQKNPRLAMEYLRIYSTMEKAQKHFNNFKKDCNDWLDNIYKDGVKKND